MLGLVTFVRAKLMSRQQRETSAFVAQSVWRTACAAPCNGYSPVERSRVRRPRTTDCSSARGTTSGVSTEILVVCHANICRSPMAAAMLTERISSLGVDASVTSAGLLHAGEPAASLGLEVMAARNLDLGAHRSTRLERALIERAEVVLTMERAQLREVVLLSPDVWPRCFTLKELARRGELVGPRNEREPLRDWLTRVHQGREKSMLLGHDESDDLADPYGGSRADFERTASELEALLDRITMLAWGRTTATR